MKMGKQTSAIAAGLLFLLFAIGLQFSPRHAPSSGKGRHLVGALPATLPGWDSRTLALGESEAGTQKAEEVLQFDDVFFREYRRGDTAEFAVYVAYWNPGKMPVQLVASHTPDQCWVESGWTFLEADHKLSLDDAAVKVVPGQGRSFRDANGKVVHVIFWHLVGDESYDYGTHVSIVPSPWSWWRDAAAGAVRAPREQYFIRLSSDRPFSELETDRGFQEMVRSLARLGLAVRE